MSTTATLNPTATRDFTRSLTGRIVLGLAATLILALAAHVSFPLPFTPVPFILTPLAVLGVGLAFGPVGGFLVCTAYLIEGLCGLPVFSPQGPGGAAQLLGPTGGFLMAYPVVAFLVGGITRALQASTPRFLAATIGGTAAIIFLFTMGAGWFMHIVPSATAHVVWLSTILPFLPGEAVKILAAAGIYSALTRAPRA